MRSVLTLIATLATVVFNVLAAAGYLNGVTPGAISDRYPTVLTPANFAFSIWTLVYLGLIAFSIYQLVPRNLVRFRSVRSLYVVTCVLNCLWLYFWHREQIGYCLGLIAAMALVLIAIIAQFSRLDDQSGGLFTKSPIGLYAGWVMAATLVNLVIFLKYLNTDLSSAVWSAIGAAALLVAAGVAVLIRFAFRNYLFSLSIAWAATAIAVEQSGNTAIVVAASICVIVCLIMAISFVMHQKSSTT